MHRVAPDRAAPPSPRRRVVAIGLMALALAGCASAPQQVADPPTIDKLRVRITKTRHAIRETREAIARSQGSPALPELHVRLAELLSEEARYHNQVAYEREDRKSRVIHAPQVRLLKLQAIDIYKQVLTRFPDTPLAPRVRFNIGHELRELGDFPQMVATLEGLVSAHPDSPLADEALLVLGDYHFDKAELDPAARFYAQITRRPLTRVTGLAHYKLAWVQVNKGSCRRALSGFEEAMKSAAAWDAHKAEVAAAGGGDPRASATFGSGAGGGADAPSAGQAIDVRREALVDLVYCYTQERDPAKAVSWLRERSVDRYAYVHALRRMADRLAFMGQREAGLAVSRALLGLAPANPDRLDDARVLYAFLAGAEDDELALLVEARDIAMLTETVAHHVQRPGLTDELRAKILEEFERYARDLLTRGQERAQRLKQGPAKGAALAQIAAGYVIYLDAFRDAPEQLAILKNLAEVLGATGRDVEAGLRWFEIADLAVEPEPRKAALLEAVGHLQRALQREGAREQVGRVVARASLRRSGEALLAGPLTPEEARAVEFAVALTYADEGRYREAIDRFTALAYQFPGTDEADAAALSALDAYESNSDYDGLIVAGRRFVAEGSPLSPATIERIRPAIARAETRKLDELALTASGSEGGDLAALERFAERYQGTSLGERALINAFVAARAVGDSGSLQRLGARLVAEYPASEQASGVITSLARNAVASLDYDRAIEAFEQAAKTQAADSSALLTTAAALMAQLGDDAGAIRVLKQAQGLAKTPAARAAVGARLAARLEQSGASPAATAAALAPLGREGGPEVLATLGLAQVALGRVEDAEVSFDGVLGGSAESSPEAKARAHYGNAEAMAVHERGAPGQPAGDGGVAEPAGGDGAGDGGAPRGRQAAGVAVRG